MRQMGVGLLRPLVRQLSLQCVSGRGRILQTALCRGRDYLPCTKHFRARWLSTLGVAELDHARTAKSLRQTLPDVHHACINQQFEDEYETVLCYPCGISTCAEAELVFISDSLHDRIVIMDGSGKVLDYIGSTTGFEDGPFEFARLRRPSSIVFDIKQRCLYIADCENHAIRRADLSSRILHTVYPKQDERPGLIQRWLRGLGFMQNSVERGEEPSSEHQVAYPWHLAMVASGHIIAATQGFEKMWVIEVDTGAVTVDPDQEPGTIFKKLVGLKSAEFADNSLDWMHLYQMLVSKGLACEGFSNLVSQVAVLRHEVFVADPGRHQILKLDLSTGHLFPIQLSNLALLGLPAWWSSDDDLQAPSSLEQLQQNEPEDTTAKFAVQPGRCLICIDVALPRGTFLVEPVTDDCIWRQGRGSLVELSTFDGELIIHKVSAAQQYLDELYNLEATDDGKMEKPADHLAVPQQSPIGIPFYSSVDVSLGSGEAIFDAVLYLKRERWAGSDQIPFGNRDKFSSGDNHVVHPQSLTLPPKQKLNDFPDGALIMKHLNFRVRCEGSARAPQTSMVLVDVQL